jgi:hypothetical protein
MMKEYKGKHWKRFGENLVIYDCVSPDFSRIAIDQITEINGELFFHQVYPTCHVGLLSIRGYVGALGKKAAENYYQVNKKGAKNNENSSSGSRLALRLGSVEP